MPVQQHGTVCHHIFKLYLTLVFAIKFKMFLVHPLILVTFVSTRGKFCRAVLQKSLIVFVFHKLHTKQVMYVCRDEQYLSISAV